MLNVTKLATLFQTQSYNERVHPVTGALFLPKRHDK